MRWIILVACLSLVSLSTSAEDQPIRETVVPYRGVRAIEAALGRFRQHIAERVAENRSDALGQHLANPEHYLVMVRSSDAFSGNIEVAFMPGDLAGVDFRGGGLHCVVDSESFEVQLCGRMK